MADIIELNEEQLRKLSQAVYSQEEKAIRNVISNKSEPDQEKHLEDCHASHELVNGLLNDAAEFKEQFANDVIVADHAHEIYSYILCCTNTSLQLVRNCSLRLAYLHKIKKHADSLTLGVKEMIEKNNVINTKRLAKDAGLYRNAVMHYTRKHQSEVCRNFSKGLKEEGLTLDQLVQRYQDRLEYSGPFKDLEDAQKLKVFDEIVQASGRGRALANELSVILGGAGTAVLLFTAGFAVWDIYSSEHKVDTAIRDGVEIGSGIGGGMLGEFVGSVIATNLFVGIAATPLFIAMTGLVAGIAGAFVVSKLAGFLVDKFLGSGGAHPIHEHDHEVCVVPMPDGIALAHQIANEQQ